MKAPCLHQSRVRAAGAALFLALTACGGDGGDVEPSLSGTLTIDFPPAYSYVEGANRQAIIVRGRATADGPVTGVVVNGAAASSEDGFATWQATVPLEDAEGKNALNASLKLASDETGAAATVTVETVPPVPATISSIAFDPATRKVFVADGERGAVYAWNPEAPGRFTLLAGEDRRAGRPPLDVPVWQLAWDGTGNRVLFGANGRLFGMNPVTGDTSVLSGGGIGEGAALPSAIPYLVSDEVHGVVYAIYSDFNLETSIIRIELASGDREPLPVNLDAEPAVGVVSAAALDAADQRLFLAQNTEHDVIVIDLDDNSRSVVVEASLDNKIQGMAFDAANDDLLFTIAAHEMVYRADVETGGLSIVSDKATGDGVLIDFPSNGIALDGAGERLFVADSQWNTIFDVDLQTGDRRVVLPQLGTGESWPVPQGLVMNEDATALRVIDFSGNRILTVPLDGRERTVFAIPDASKDRLAYIQRALDAPVLYAQDFLDGALYAIDAVTGTMTSLPANVETAFDSNVNEFIVDHGGQQAWYLIDGSGGGEDVIGRMDLATGVGEIVSGDGKGAGDPLTDAEQIAWEPETDRIAVWHGDRMAFIDPGTGDREFGEVAEAMTGISDLQYDAGSQSFLISDFSGVYRYSLDDGAVTAIVSWEDGKGLSGMNYGGPFVHDGARGVIYLSSEEFGTIMVIDAVTGEEVILAR